MLYICATPIGNLKDISLRALEILAHADVVLCEDKRVSQQLLNYHNILAKRLVSLHEHNENQITQQVIQWLDSGLTIVQISDAGTPGIADPGARLCRQVRAHGFTIAPLPGCCAYISLLSVSGIDCPSLFYGFLPATSTKRRKVLEQWNNITDYSVCIYEAPHRIIECVEDIIKVLGAERLIVLGRELTKKFETINELPANRLLEFIIADNNQQRGEFVLLIAPYEYSKTKAQQTQPALTPEHIRVVELLRKHLPPRKVAQLAFEISQADKNTVYDYLIAKE